ncbi:hypothetical protein JIN85_01075 [Luteolibacter pohnpeiensis]|uniref:Uncharacterized protein n=1 Tax=Luteolibacter pohnpeiensis TaxID=454153 RepID=A0A934VUY4_9BACT|nr:hypothetical protein [Luteolibacter pohnpeiensis]MBK1880984.1 hypothetical protein [Luteolibacter pohnpeiensis]
MKWDNYRWVEISRSELLSFIFSRDRSHRTSSPPKSRRLLAGFEGYHSNSEERPEVLVIEDEDAEDLMAWLYAFAADFMPLSMHFQVVLASDFDAIMRTDSFSNPIFEPVWASMILGEFMMRGRGSKVLKDFYISWIETSCSYSLLAALQVYGDNKLIYDTFIGRLRRLKANEQLGFPELRLETLEVAWKVCIDLPDRAYQFEREDEFLFVQRLFHLLESSANRQFSHEFLDLLYSSYFKSDSVERRLTGFDQVVRKCSDQNLSDQTEVGFYLGAAAFLVGRGTSHLGLIDRPASSFPSAYLWFSILAGLCGKNSWDPRWFELIRRITPFLRSKRLEGDKPADLCWVEFSAMERSRESLSFAKDIVRIFPSSLVLELIPNVHFQIRLARESADSERSTTGGSPTKGSNRELILQIESLLKRLTKGLDTQSSQIPEQPELKLITEEKSNRKKRSSD